MPRSLLLSVVAAITLAACSKQETDAGAAPAPEAEAPDVAAPAEDAADDAAGAAEDAAATVDSTAAAAEDTMQAAEETMDSTTVPAEVPTDMPAPADTTAGY
jgi:hypothetical protein